MNPTYTIKQAGYAYLYVSNEHPYLTDVYFDDVTMTLTPSPVVQMEDFYPFGLSFNSATRQNTVPQNYLYNGKEQLNDLAIGWYDYRARMYMPEIGRWGVVDPKSETSRRWSPYTYALDNPIRFIDPDGMEATGDFDFVRGGYGERILAGGAGVQTNAQTENSSGKATNNYTVTYKDGSSSHVSGQTDSEILKYIGVKGNNQTGGGPGDPKKKSNGGSRGFSWSNFDFFAGGEAAATLGWRNFAVEVKNIGGIDYKKNARDWRRSSSTQYGGSKPSNSATINRFSISAGLGATMQTNNDGKAFTESYSVGWEMLGVQANFDSKGDITDVRFGFDSGVSVAIFGGLEFSLQLGAIYVNK